MFDFLKKEIVYVDKLNEWTKTKVHDFNMLDKVWILRTIKQSYYSHPHHNYKRDIEWKPQEWVIIGTCEESLYTEFPSWEVVEHEWWEYMENNEHKIFMSFQWKQVYRYRKWYRVLLRDWSYIDAHTVKKSHWEFQEEFEHMTAIEKKKQEVLEAQQRYENSLHEMDDLLKKWREIQTKLVNKIIK